LRGILKKYAKANNEKYFEILGKHGATSAEDVINFEPEAQQSVLRDLEKEIRI